jgi:glycosyltransferase involved in cell wall biosynthesis
VSEFPQALARWGIETRLTFCSLSTGERRLSAHQAHIQFCTQALTASQNLCLREGTPESMDLFESSDLLLIAGSASLLFNQPYLVRLVSQVSMPTFFVLLYPLAEIEFYFGASIRNVVSEILSACANACDCLIVPSEYVRNEVATHCDIHVPVVQIPPGVDLQYLQRDVGGTADKEKRAISVSRLVAHKNTDALLEAWELVHDRIPQSTLTLVGSPSSIIEGWQGLQGVDYAGEVTDTEKIQLLCRSRVLVSTSAIESFGLSLVEAMAAGVPVVAVRSTAVPELVRHNVNGILVDPIESLRRLPDTVVTCSKPDVSQLCEAVVRFMDDNHYYKTFEQACLQSSAPYDWSLVIEKYVDLFKALSS